ncbi:MAG: penicillin-binding protein [Sphingomonas sanxanigenens]|uniref:Penicillin-binding protein n=1 Tax=Sphingomonas sanxanigenens TaxID=397260 RepID=A0A2W5A591_9SPHN|nr:MAG: penicillin-binding protein [Sphingomonas sanxanigenens]
MRDDEPDLLNPDPGAPSPAGATPYDDAPAAPPPSRVRIWWRRIKWASLILGGLFALLVGWLLVTAPLSRSLKPIAPPSVVLLAADGTPISRRGAIIAKPVEVAKLPKYVPGAFTSIEDRRFYSHWGVDPIGIARATWHNMRAGGLREGGSTITQQLAKVAFTNADRTAGRKLREALIAFWLEARLSKDEILQRYLSNVYFGDNVYGLRAASQHYFNREPERLTVAQAAMLAGLVKAPSRLAPTSNLKGAQARQKLVVAAMLDAGVITASQARAAGPATLNVRPVADVPSGTYFADWVLPDARDRAGDVYAEQKIQTTLEVPLQRAAERAVRRSGLGRAQVAMVVMRPDGRVVAMVGGKSYAASPFNRATQARRQPGSTFKLFVYLAALRAGMTPDSTVDDDPVTIEGWSPKNSDGRYLGRITLRQAFARSSNVAAARLIQQVGVKQVVRAARDLGITTPIGDDATIALGTSGVTLLELTSAYAAVADGAYPVKPHGLPEKERGWYDSIFNRQSHFDDGTHKKLLDLLSASVNSGTSHSARLNVQAFGKTGTTQDGRDAIFIGFAGGLITGVWVGNDDNSPLPGLHGGGLPALIWRDFMTSAVAGAAIPAAPEEDDEADNVSDEDMDLANAASFSIDTDLGSVQLNVSLGPDGLNLSARPGERRGPPPMPPEQRAPPPEDEEPDGGPRD